MLVFSVIAVCDVCGEAITEVELFSGTFKSTSMSAVVKQVRNSTKKKLKVYKTSGRCICPDCKETEHLAPAWSKKSKKKKVVLRVKQKEHG